MPEAKFSITQTRLPQTDSRIVRAQPDRLLNVGYRLFVTAENNFGEASRKVERRVIRIDGQSGVGGVKPVVSALRISQV
jgi:hypothetical protein